MKNGVISRKATFSEKKLSIRKKRLRDRKKLPHKSCLRHQKKQIKSSEKAALSVSSYGKAPFYGGEKQLSLKRKLDKLLVPHSPQEIVPKSCCRKGTKLNPEIMEL